MQSSNQTIDLLLDFFQKNPRDFTYFAVGSYPRYLNFEEFTLEIDQIFPMFLRDFINSNDETIRVVHYDPMFNNTDGLDFLHKYFKSLSSLTLDFKYSDDDGFHCWRTSDYRIEVFIIGEEFNIPYEKLHIHSMIMHHLTTNTKLVFL